MRIGVQIPLTMRQRREHTREIGLLGGCRGNLLTVAIDLELLSARACDEVLDTIRAGRLIAGVAEENETLIEEALRGLRKSLS